MLDVEASFEKLLGRQPSEKEIQSLYRVKNALNIRDNDALWLVLMALESYDTLYRKYPAMISSQVTQIIEDQKAAMATIADAETKKALGTLAEAVGKTSELIAVRLAITSRLQSWGWTLLGVVSFGVLCVFVGFVLGSGRLPFWAQVTPGQGPLATILGTLARTQAGWLAFIGGGAAALSSLWHARQDVLAGKRLGLLISAAALLVLSMLFLWPLL